MKLLWTALAQLDRASFAAKNKIDKMIGRDAFEARMEELVKDVHLPEKVIQYDA